MINIEERVEAAHKNFKAGYNCCQAVVLAYSDVMGVDKELLATISAPFGGGMGRLREVCGSVSGMLMVSSCIFKANDPTDTEAKKCSYQAVQDLAHRFSRENGSIVCRELLGLPVKHESPTPEQRTEEYYKKRPCSEYVMCSARIMGELINTQSTLNNKAD